MKALETLKTSLGPTGLGFAGVFTWLSARYRHFGPSGIWSLIVQRLRPLVLATTAGLLINWLQRLGCWLIYDLMVLWKLLVVFRVSEFEIGLI